MERHPGPHGQEWSGRSATDREVPGPLVVQLAALRFDPQIDGMPVSFRLSFAEAMGHGAPYTRPHAVGSSGMARILIIEDEADLGSLLEYNLGDGRRRTHSRASISAPRAGSPIVLLDLIPDVLGARSPAPARGETQHAIIMVMPAGRRSTRSEPGARRR